MCDVRCTMYDLRCTMCDVRCTMCDVRCTMYDFHHFTISPFEKRSLNETLRSFIKCHVK
ncbi:MAG: hypothetical protein ACOYM0_07660 [Bacteroidales bacterium]